MITDLSSTEFKSYLILSFAYIPVCFKSNFQQKFKFILCFYIFGLLKHTLFWILIFSLSYLYFRCYFVYSLDIAPISSLFSVQNAFLLYLDANTIYLQFHIVYTKRSVVIIYRFQVSTNFYVCGHATSNSAE